MELFREIRFLIRSFLIVAGVLAAASPAHALVRFGLQANIPTMNNRDISTVPAASETFGEGYLLVQMQKESSYFVTLGYLSLTSVAPVSATQTSTMNSGNPYMGFTAFLFENFVSIFIGAAPYIQAEYAQAGSATETWGGTAGYAKLNFHPQLTEKLFLDFSLSYYAATYSFKSSGTSVSNVRNFNQTILAPMVGFQYMF